MRSIVSLTAFVCACGLAVYADGGLARALRWEELPAATARRLRDAGLDAPAFAAFLAEQERATDARVRESDLDALIYYALQSMAFTDAPPLEPALSAKAFVDRLDAASRARFLAGEIAPADRVPPDVRARLARLGPALEAPMPGSRLAYFRDLVGREAPGAGVERFLLGEFVRAARFLYEKEFVAPAGPHGVDAIAGLYRQRALSTDTSIEASYLVHLGLETLRAIDAERRIRRVLIVGPGLDLAPRTGLLEVAPPQSYQPYAVLDSLVSLGLSRLDEAMVVCGDVNPHVVEHLEAARARDVAMTLVSGIGDTGTTRLDDDYRRYFDRLGRSIGRETTSPGLSRHEGHLFKSLQVGRDASRAIAATRLDVAAQRLDEEAFDLIVATNVFLYMGDMALTLALAGISAMLAPGGILIHNEPRPLVAAVTAEQEMPVVHARTARVALVQGAAAPLYDSVFVHQKGRPR